MIDSASARGAAASRAIHVLGLCGSLRSASLNALLLRACARLPLMGVQLRLYPSLGALPLFNPDLESLNLAPVEALRSAINAADALLIASPEYAHGVSGVMKNALDWMVGNESFVHKPVALLNASPRAIHAQSALRETLVTMSADVVDAACLAVPLLGSNLTEDGVLAHPQIAESLLNSLRALARTVPTRG